MQQKLEQYIAQIPSADSAAISQAQERMDSLIKPPGSLGVLESIAVKLAGITGSVKNKIGKKCVIIMSSDNGVVEEGVASAPQEVTALMTGLFIRGVTGVAAIARQMGTDLRVYDMGVNADLDIPGVINKKIRKSTDNIAKGPAMTRDEALTAILTGIEAAENAVKEGYTLIGVGEMGIGNTSTSSAILCAMTGCTAEDSVGRGAGLKEEAFRLKSDIVDRAVRQNKPDISDPVDVLAKLGGFDIAAMTGVFLGAAKNRVPVVIDGFISIAAAFVATKLCPAARDFMFASHVSVEPGYVKYLEQMDMPAPLNLGMRLGEGSGCPIMFSVMEAACAVMNDVATFPEALGNAGAEYLENIEES